MFLRSRSIESRILPSDTSTTFSQDWQRFKEDSPTIDLSDSSDSTEWASMSGASSSASLNSLGSDQNVEESVCFRLKPVSWLYSFVLKAFEVKIYCFKSVHLSTQISHLNYYRNMKTEIVDLEANMSRSNVGHLVLRQRHRQQRTHSIYTQTAMQLSGFDLASTRLLSPSREQLKAQYPNG